jgi:protein-S-isoprenylcysteine O-methyltransferase Ste14
MICKKCGTEIADKALICYRCGTSTFEPAARTPRRRPSPPLWSSAIALVILVIAALFMNRAAIGETPRLLGWILLVLAAVLVVWRFRRRR